MTSTEVVPVPEPCPVAVACWSCLSTDGLRALVASSPHGAFCWTACGRCAAGGAHVRITGDAALRLAIEHREHTGPARP